jgi:hypothetical protein
MTMMEKCIVDTCLTCAKKGESCSKGKECCKYNMGEDCVVVNGMSKTGQCTKCDAKGTNCNAKVNGCCSGKCLLRVSKAPKGKRGKVPKVMEVFKCE